MSEKDQTSNEHDDFYKILRKRIHKWAKSKAGKEYKWLEYILVAPDMFHLMCKLIIDGDVPMEHKAKLGLAIAYFVSPIDLIPELIIGPVGYIDDIALTAYVLNGLVNEVDPEIIKRNWAGEGDILEIIKKILKKTDEMIGKGLWKKIIDFVDKMKK